MQSLAGRNQHLAEGLSLDLVIAERYDHYNKSGLQQGSKTVTKDIKITTKASSGGHENR